MGAAAVCPEFAKLRAKMIAISPASVEGSKGHVKKIKVLFSLLSDSGVVAARAFGLAFKVDDATVTKYKGFGIAPEQASRRDHDVLPVPAVYIVDRSGIVRFARSNPDDTKRLDPPTILAELKKTT